MQRSLVLRLFLLAALAGLLVACGGSEAAPGEDGVYRVEMLDNRFDVLDLQIPVGASVNFVGAGDDRHNAVAADGSWSTEDVFGSLDQYEGDEAVLTFDAPGEYLYFCTFHGTANGGGMAARLTVGDPDASPKAQGVVDTEAPAEWSGTTRNVPADYPTIQAAVDAADPGDLVMIANGVYREQVEITTDSLVLRGEDRNDTIIDGEFVRDNGIFVAGADGVAVENLTVRNALANGIFWTGVLGYRASYVTAIDNGSYGIYAFDSSDGLFERSYASGSPDSGFYIGQCDPCNAVIDDIVSEWNGLGYSGTNASGNIYLINSVWRNNVAGIVPNTLDSELLPPVHDVTIVGNLVHDTGNDIAPRFNAPHSGFGSGIIVAGGNDFLIERNRVVNSKTNGIAVMPNLDTNFWQSEGNVIRDNVVEGSARADLALAAPARGGNCFEGNEARTTLPPGLQVFQSCDGLRIPFGFELGGATESLGRIAENSLGLRPDPELGSAPKPPRLESLPADALIRPAVGVFASFPLDLASLEVPDLPPGVTVTQAKGITVFGLFFASALSVFFGLYAYFLPFVLYAAWVAIALWDLARRSDLSRGATMRWIAIVLVVPFIGVVLYYILGKSPIPAWQRRAFVGGGFAAYLVILVVGALVGGIV